MKDAIKEGDFKVITQLISEGYNLDLLVKEHYSGMDLDWMQKYTETKVLDNIEYEKWPLLAVLYKDIDLECLIKNYSKNFGKKLNQIVKISGYPTFSIKDLLIRELIEKKKYELIFEYFNINKINYYNIGLLYENDFAMIEEFIDRGLDPNTRINEGMYLFTQLVLDGHDVLAKKIWDKDLDLNKPVSHLSAPSILEQMIINKKLDWAERIITSFNKNPEELEMMVFNRDKTSYEKLIADIDTYHFLVKYFGIQ